MVKVYFKPNTTDNGKRRKPIEIEDEFIVTSTGGLQFVDEVGKVHWINLDIIEEIVQI